MANSAAASFHIKYLGLPISINPRSKVFLGPVIEKVSRRLDGWKKMMFSFEGRILIVKSYLSSIPIDFLSLYKALGCVVRSL